MLRVYVFCFLFIVCFIFSVMFLFSVMLFFFCIFYVKIFCDIVCVLCAGLCVDVIRSHALYVCAHAVRITTECGYVVSCLCFYCLFHFSVFFFIIFFTFFFVKIFYGIVCVLCADTMCSRALVLVVCWWCACGALVLVVCWWRACAVVVCVRVCVCVCECMCE